MFKVTEHDARTLSWWFSERENIDFAPKYQRKGKIWSVDDKTYLVDSILNEYDIPKIYLVDFTFFDSPLNEKKVAYAVVDGKQRFEAIYDFFDGTLVLSDKFRYDANPLLKLGGLSYKDLKSQYPKVASKFENYNLTVMSVITDEEGKINELFLRLNRSKPLTGAETRSAMLGVVSDYIAVFVSHEFFANRISFNTKRKQDYNLAAKIFLIEFRGRFADTKKMHLDRFVDEGIKAESDSFDTAAQRVVETLSLMCHAFLPKDTLLKSEGPIAVYYWFIRNIDPALVPKVREFLVQFDKARTINRRKAAKPSQTEGLLEQREEIDSELLNYDVMNRSTNDQGSLQGRYDILSQRFAFFVATGSLSHFSGS